VANGAVGKLQQDLNQVCTLVVAGA
jgi:hypothetical protein